MSCSLTPTLHREEVPYIEVDGTDLRVNIDFTYGYFPLAITDMSNCLDESHKILNTYAANVPLTQSFVHPEQFDKVEPPVQVEYEVPKILFKERGATFGELSMVMAALNEAITQEFQTSLSFRFAIEQDGHFRGEGSVLPNPNVRTTVAPGNFTVT